MTIPTNISYSILLNLYRNLPTHVKNVIRLMLNLTFIILPHVIKDLREILFFKIYIYILTFFLKLFNVLKFTIMLIKEKKNPWLFYEHGSFFEKKIIFKKYIILLKWFYWLGLLNFFWVFVYFNENICKNILNAYSPVPNIKKKKTKIRSSFQSL